jgi:hypothetical protein
MSERIFQQGFIFLLVPHYMCTLTSVTAQFSIFSVMFCRSLFVLLSFFFGPLCCLSFFDFWILITPLVSPSLWLLSCLSFLSFLLGPLCCLSFFDFRILITPLISSSLWLLSCLSFCD